MNMLIEELQQLGSNPWSWAVVGIMALFAIHSAVFFFLCPYSRGTAEIGDADVEMARAEDHHAGARFLVLMLGGVILSLVGLFMIAKGISPALALAALVIGIFVTQTEPQRLLIREHKRAVVATRDEISDVRTGARDRLKSSHRTLALTNLTLLGAVTAGLLAF